MVDRERDGDGAGNDPSGGFDFGQLVIETQASLPALRTSRGVEGDVALGRAGAGAAEIVDIGRRMRYRSPEPKRRVGLPADGPEGFEGRQHTRIL